MWFPLNKSFNTDVGSFVGEEEEIVLIARSAQIDEAVRDLVRIGLDRVTGWYEARKVAAYEDDGSRLATLTDVSIDEARSILGDKRAAVLDVRRATEFAEGRIVHAINIAHTRLASRLDEVPGDRTVIVHCRSGGRSGRACSFLQRRGFEVMNLKGGMLAWEAAGAPVEH
jgi:hydroxyacylglutathione hydrolase